MPPPALRILLLSAYDAASHKRWRTRLVRELSHHEWTTLALPPRFFSWRMRGNPLTWAFNHSDVLANEYDLILATSMVDLTALRGLIPSLARVPTIYYFHENQFAYPVREPAMQREVFHFCMHQLLSGLCADRLCFNSRYNKDTFLQGVRDMMKKMPDHVPPGIAERLEAKATVLPVPLEPHCYFERTEHTKRNPEAKLQLVWNHRWEYDKAPERLFDAARLLKQRGVPFVLHVVGQQFRSQPPAFAAAQKDLADNIGEWGYLTDVSAYRTLLQTCDMTISTALHDFQGLALLEAVAAGCRPVVPDRLAYPQWIPEAYRYASHPDDKDAECKALADHIASCHNAKVSGKTDTQVDIQALSWNLMKSKYDEVIVNTYEAHTTVSSN